MSKKPLRVRGFNVRHAPSDDLVQIIFKDADDNQSVVEFLRTDIPLILTRLHVALRAIIAPKGKDKIRIMTVKSIDAAIAKDGTPILKIGTAGLPELAFALNPDQAEAIEGWLGNALAALQGRKDRLQ
jgi:hypothetical protein